MLVGLWAQEVAKYKTEKSLNRVLLLSDGNANVGLTSTEQIKHIAQLADLDVTTSPMALGMSSMNNDRNGK